MQQGATMDMVDFMRPKYPIEGIPVDDLAAALSVMKASPDVGDVRVLRIEAMHDGHLLVQTGFQAAIRAGSGKSVHRVGRERGRRG